MGSFPTVTDAVKVEQQPVQLVLLFNNELRALSKHCKDKTLLCLPLPPQKKKTHTKRGGGEHNPSPMDQRLTQLNVLLCHFLLFLLLRTLPSECHLHKITEEAVLPLLLQSR